MEVGVHIKQENTCAHSAPSPRRDHPPLLGRPCQVGALIETDSEHGGELELAPFVKEEVVNEAHHFLNALENDCSSNCKEDDSVSAGMDSIGEPADADITGPRILTTGMLRTGSTSGRGQHVCQQCHFTTASKQHLQSHIVNRHTTGKPFACDHCQFRTKTSYSLSRHTLVMHRGVPKRYACSHCQFRTKTRYLLKRHVINRHTADRPYACSQCEYRCKSAACLRRHMSHRHSTDKPFACPRCAYRGKTREQVRRHDTARHSSGAQKPFLCHHCPAFTTNTRFSLQRHVAVMHVNTGRPYTCAECGFTTKTSPLLKSHVINKHTTDKPFVCGECPYKAKKANQLRRHFANKHSSTPVAWSHAYSLCEYRAKSNQHLKLHVINRHTSEQPYRCQHCAFRTKTRSSLTRHTSIIHCAQN